VEHMAVGSGCCFVIEANIWWWSLAFTFFLSIGV
jgi:hypothetical protein